MVWYQLYLSKIFTPLLTTLAPPSLLAKRPPLLLLFTPKPVLSCDCRFLLKRLITILKFIILFALPFSPVAWREKKYYGSAAGIRTKQMRLTAILSSVMQKPRPCIMIYM